MSIQNFPRIPNIALRKSADEPKRAETSIQENHSIYTGFYPKHHRIQGFSSIYYIRIIINYEKTNTDKYNFPSKIKYFRRFLMISQIRFSLKHQIPFKNQISGNHQKHLKTLKRFAILENHSNVWRPELSQRSVFMISGTCKTSKFTCILQVKKVCSRELSEIASQKQWNWLWPSIAKSLVIRQMVVQCTAGSGQGSLAARSLRFFLFSVLAECLMCANCYRQAQ